MRRSVPWCGIVLLALLGGPASAGPGVDEIRAAVDSGRAQAISLFREFLALPNDAHNADDIEALLAWMEESFGRRGFDVSRIATEGSPALLLERQLADDAPTILVYLQADGQPVDPAQWNQASPFLPVLKERAADGNWAEIPWAMLELGVDPEWRVFARSAADSKGPMTQFMMAMQLLDELDFEANYNLKVLVDTEEELGSPHLAAAVAANRDRLAADFLLIFDGPPHASNQPTVSFGARGIATVTLKTYGPRVAQHSGHYGNFVPNPAFGLARLLAAMKDEDGRVQIPGFYDGIEIDDNTRRILSDVPDEEARLLAEMGVAEAESVAATLQEAIQYPSLNVRGMSAAWTGADARTVIPPEAVAEIDIRLVPESDPQRLIDALRAFIVEQGYVVVDREPTEAERQRHPRLASMVHEVSYGAFRSGFDEPPGRMARAGMRKLYGREPILIRSMGGSVPIAPIVAALDIPAAIVPTVNIDNNQHSPNENLRVGSFFEGIAVLMAILGQEIDVSDAPATVHDDAP